MAKFRFNLREASSQSETAIHLIVRWNRNRLVFPTGLEIKPKFWETDKEKDNFQRAKRVKQFPTYLEFNARLDNIESIAKNAFRRYVNDKNHEPSVEVYRAMLNRDLNKKVVGELDLFGFFEQFINESKIKVNAKTGRIYSGNTIKNYNNTYNHLKKYSLLKKKRISFDTIDLDFYHNFNSYLTVEKKFATNTIASIFKDIKTVLNDATERGINTNLSFRSKKFQVVTQDTDNVYLTENELNDLYHLDLSKNQRLERVRDLFLVGCYTGLRFSDFTMLGPQNIKDGNIEIETQKTKTKIVIPLDPKISAILKKYKGHLPAGVSNQKTNEYLKELANDEKRLSCLQEPVSIKTTKGGVTIYQTFKKYEKISTHSARRSFATNAYLRGTPPLIIMAITGHNTEKSFLKYIKLGSREKAKIFEMYMKKDNNLKVIS